MITDKIAGLRQNYTTPKSHGEIREGVYSIIRTENGSQINPQEISRLETLARQEKQAYLIQTALGVVGGIAGLTTMLLRDEFAAQFRFISENLEKIAHDFAVPLGFLIAIAGAVHFGRSLRLYLDSRYYSHQLLSYSLNRMDVPEKVM